MLSAVIATTFMSGCDEAGEMENLARKVTESVKHEWNEISHSDAIKQLSAKSQKSFQEAIEAAKTGSKALEEKAAEAVKATTQELYAEWQSAMKPLDGPFIVPPKCLLSMAVGAGAITAASGLGLAALGFSTEGVMAESLAALWQSSLGNVAKDSLFAKLQSLGAVGLSKSIDFEVLGVVASVSACFCGVVNELCHNCLQSDRVIASSAALTIPANSSVYIV